MADKIFTVALPPGDGDSRVFEVVLSTCVNGPPNVMAVMAVRVGERRGGRLEFGKWEAPLFYLCRDADPSTLGEIILEAHRSARYAPAL